MANGNINVDATSRSKIFSVATSSFNEKDSTGALYKMDCFAGTMAGAIPPLIDISNCLFIHEGERILHGDDKCCDHSSRVAISMDSHFMFFRCLDAGSLFALSVKTPVISICRQGEKKRTHVEDKNISDPAAHFKKAISPFLPGKRQNEIISLARISFLNYDSKNKIPLFASTPHTVAVSSKKKFSDHCQ